MKKLSVLLLFILAACSSTPPQPGMKVGKPYEVDGTTYYPRYEPEYDKTGDASWYGPGFHGKYTASGEIFNQNDITAAHPTLPMPCLVRVTNLSNGKSLIVRINDRGPFKSHRIIDLSKESAHRLGIASITRVRVQFLKKETTEYLASLQQGGARVIDMAQYNRDAEKPVAPAPEVELAEADEPAQAAPSQIVENINATSHAGQTVDDAAPVITVSEDELESPTPAPVKHTGVIKDAWADDNAALAKTAKQESNAFSPPATQTPTKPVLLARADSSELTAKQDASDEDNAVASTQENYLIQAGAFAAEENARRLASRLAHVASLSIDKVDSQERSWWRVRLGPFKNKQSADDALLRVRAAGAADARIIHL